MQPSFYETKQPGPPGHVQWAIQGQLRIGRCNVQPAFQPFWQQAWLAKTHHKAQGQMSIASVRSRQPLNLVTGLRL